MMHRPPSPTLFPYTTLFRSVERAYRSAGLTHQANAVMKCRELGECSKALTESEAYAAYRSGHLAAGLGEPGSETGHGDASAADRKSTRLNSSHVEISYAGFC